MSDDNDDDDDYDGRGWAKLAGWLDKGNFLPGISKCLPGGAELCSLIDSQRESQLVLFIYRQQWV